MLSDRSDVRRPARAMSPARRQFYEQRLGFTPQSEVAGGVLDAIGGGTAAFLYPTPNAGTSQASQAY